MSLAECRNGRCRPCHVSTNWPTILQFPRSVAVCVGRLNLSCVRLILGAAPQHGGGPRRPRSIPAKAKEDPDGDLAAERLSYRGIFSVGMQDIMGIALVLLRRRRSLLDVAGIAQSASSKVSAIQITASSIFLQADLRNSSPWEGSP